MPLYTLACPLCGHKFEAWALGKDRDAIACESCGAARVETNYAAQSVKPEREWHGTERRSTWRFDPAGLPQLKAECPSIELDADGYVIYRSDRHQRQVLKELAAVKEKYKAEELAEAQSLGPVERAAAVLEIESRYAML